MFNFFEFCDCVIFITIENLLHELKTGYQYKNNL